MSSLAEVLAGTAMWHVEEGNALELLRLLPEGCVQCLMSSPPYFGLRKYEGVEPAPWPEVTYTPMAGVSTITVPAMTCCLGGEPDPLAFIGHLVLIFREVWRVMRDDGVMFVNLGDSYNAAGRVGHGTRIGFKQSTNRASDAGADACRPDAPGLKQKDLIGTPWRLAFALQADGWWLRQCITWAKLSPMPGSQRDRPTTATEDIFLFSKAPSYFYDVDACRVPQSEGSLARYAYPVQDFRSGTVNGTAARSGGAMSVAGDEAVLREPMEVNPAGRNLWSWWEVEPDECGNLLPVAWKLANEPSYEKHYASYPSEIPRRCLKLGTSSHGCCPSCLAPWRRVTERTKLRRERPNELTKRTGAAGTGNHCGNTVAGVSTVTLGWEAGCDCGREDVMPCLSLDLFCGSGTTGVVARELGLRFIGIDASPQYAAMARRRIASVAPLLDVSSTRTVAPKVEQPTLFG